ncbi:MAG: glycosyltransferase [Candidatus Devosia euplotis]|nr:glycosyltransferase [Candidatus Devosia euplotis]
MRQTGAIVLESAYAQKTYAALIGSPTCLALIIHNEPAPDEFVPVAAEADAADFVFIGELRELKGVHVLIEALAGVMRADGRPATLVMAGDGGSRDALVAQIARLGLTDRASLIGTQPARPSLARGRIAVVPSFAESLPYVALEAAAAQLSVISTRVSGSPEIFGPTAASLVPANDVQALGTAMQAALDDPEAALAEMKVRGDYIAEHFSLKRTTGDIEALYERLLAQ